MTMRVLSCAPGRLPALAIAAALATTAAGCVSSAATAPAASSPSTASTGVFPVTIKAANGTVHLAKRPVSIISLAPSDTEMLYAIGAGGQVKAVDQDSNYPPQAPVTKLSGLTPNIEAIVAQKPDLVVVSYDAAALTKRLASFSIPVLDLPAPTSVNDLYSEFGELGRATGDTSQAGREVASLRQQISQIAAQAPHPARPLTYYYELDQTYYSVTSATFIGKLLALLGMKSIADSAKGAAAAGGYPQLSAEYIVKANPDFIILADTLCCHQSPATVAKRPGWAGLTAVRSKHIIGLNDDIASRWGPRIIDLLRTVLASIRGSQ
jgi:iron complex transport system substrate-binding protein